MLSIIRNIENYIRSQSMVNDLSIGKDYIFLKSDENKLVIHRNIADGIFNRYIGRCQVSIKVNPLKKWTSKTGLIVIIGNNEEIKTGRPEKLYNGYSIREIRKGTKLSKSTIYGYLEKVVNTQKPNAKKIDKFINKKNINM